MFSTFLRTIAGAVTCGIGLSVSFCYAGESSLYVFFPTTVRPFVLQKQLSEDLPGYTVTAFGRYSDFVEKVRHDAPDAILTKPDVIRQLGSYSMAASGMHSGVIEEQYFLLSAANSDSAQATAANARTIGVIDFLGRHGMDSLAGVIFKSAPRLNRVSKVEDLLPLLTFGMAGEVLVSERNADYLTGTSKIRFNRKEVPRGRIGIIALGIRKNVSAEKTVQRIRKLPQATCTMLEIETWK